MSSMIILCLSPKLLKLESPEDPSWGLCSFLFIINDLYKVSKNLHPLMYADDSIGNLLVSGDDSNELIEIANSDF